MPFDSMGRNKKGGYRASPYELGVCEKDFFSTQERRAEKPRLAEPPPKLQDLKPGDRVEGLGNFGKPTGEFGTVEQANEDDAVVKWDDAGRMRLPQPWLKKV